jgi:addiction module RelE/StbE family toxin
MIVGFTDEALADLSSIRAYLAERNPDAANRIGRRIVEATDSLDMHPNRGKPGLVEGTREITTVWPYVIVYRVTPAEVQILRVWHGAQDRAAT